MSATSQARLHGMFGRTSTYKTFLVVSFNFLAQYTQLTKKHGRLLYCITEENATPCNKPTLFMMLLEMTRTSWPLGITSKCHAVRRKTKKVAILAVLADWGGGGACGAYSIKTTILDHALIKKNT